VVGEAEGGICSGKMMGGRYRLLSMLGRGGMAQVWRGFDQRLDREVAVKILNIQEAPDAGERFEREARTAAALTHANIVSLHDADSVDGVDYLVMELVEGETLSQRIRRGPLPAAEIADLAGQICDALAAAHAAGIVHRDIKPGNVLITKGGLVKVCDFGIACHDNEALDAASDTAVGTAQYMAPEQTRGGPATPRTDLYGLGCVIYAMATGHPPFTSKTSARVAWQHVNELPVPLASRRPDTPSWLDNLVASLLAKEPAERPYSAAEVRGLLPPSPKPEHSPRLDHSTRPEPSTRPDHSPRPEPSPRPDGKRGAERAHRPTRTAFLSGDTTAQLAPPVGPRIAGRARLAATGVLSFVGLAAVVLVLTAVSANDMPIPVLERPAATQPPPSSEEEPPPLQVQPVSDPADALDALRAVLDDQGRAGNIGGKPLREIDKQLDEIGRDLARGEGGKAAGKLEDVAKTLAELHDEGRIDALTLYTVQAALGNLAEQLPAANDD